MYEDGGRCCRIVVAIGGGGGNLSRDVKFASICYISLSGRPLLSIVSSSSP